MSAAWDLRDSGFSCRAELDEWLEFVAWSHDPEADPRRYAFDEIAGWSPTWLIRAADVRPFIAALADLLVADLLRVSCENA